MYVNVVYFTLQLKNLGLVRLNTLFRISPTISGRDSLQTHDFALESTFPPLQLDTGVFYEVHWPFPCLYDLAVHATLTPGMVLSELNSFSFMSLILIITRLRIRKRRSYQVTFLQSVNNLSLTAYDKSWRCQGMSEAGPYLSNSSSQCGRW